MQVVPRLVQLVQLVRAICAISAINAIIVISAFSRPAGPFFLQYVVKSLIKSTGRGLCLQIFYKMGPSTRKGLLFLEYLLKRDIKSSRGDLFFFLGIL